MKLELIKNGELRLLENMNKQDSQPCILFNIGTNPFFMISLEDHSMSKQEYKECFSKWGNKNMDLLLLYRWRLVSSIFNLRFKDLQASTLLTLIHSSMFTIGCWVKDSEQRSCDMKMQNWDRAFNVKRWLLVQ